MSEWDWMKSWLETKIFDNTDEVNRDRARAFIEALVQMREIEIKFPQVCGEKASILKKAKV